MVTGDELGPQNTAKSLDSQSWSESLSSFSLCLRYPTPTGTKQPKFASEQRSRGVAPCRKAAWSGVVPMVLVTRPVTRGSSRCWGSEPPRRPVGVPRPRDLGRSARLPCAGLRPADDEADLATFSAYTGRLAPREGRLPGGRVRRRVAERKSQVTALVPVYDAAQAVTAGAAASTCPSLCRTSVARSPGRPELLPRGDRGVVRPEPRGSARGGRHDRDRRGREPRGAPAHPRG